MFFKKWRRNYKFRDSLTQSDFGRESLVNKCVRGNCNRAIDMVVSTGNEDTNTFSQNEKNCGTNIAQISSSTSVQLTSNRNIESIVGDESSSFSHTSHNRKFLPTSVIDGVELNENKFYSPSSKQISGHENEYENENVHFRSAVRDKMKNLSDNGILEKSVMHKENIGNGTKVPVFANENIGRNNLRDCLTDLLENNSVSEEMVEKLRREKENIRRRDRISRAIFLQKL